VNSIWATSSGFNHTQFFISSLVKAHWVRFRSGGTMSAHEDQLVRRVAAAPAVPYGSRPLARRQSSMRACALIAKALRKRLHLHRLLSERSSPDRRRVPVVSRVASIQLLAENTVAPCRWRAGRERAGQFRVESISLFLVVGPRRLLF
jgi:hypothetical protein